MQFSIHSCWQIKNRNLELWRFSLQFHDFLRIVKVFHFTIFLFRFDDFSYASRKNPSKWLKEIFWRIFDSISRFFIRNLPFHNFLTPPKVLRDFRKLFQSFQSSNWNKKIAKWNTLTMHKKFMKLKWESSKSRFWCFIGQQEWFENCIFPNWHHDLLFHKSIILFQFCIFFSVRGDERIIRSCAYEEYKDSQGKVRDCYKTVLEEYNTYVCTCEGDGCNGSQNIQVSMFSVLCAAILAAVFK